jgi:hypothetical protein
MWCTILPPPPQQTHLSRGRGEACAGFIDTFKLATTKIKMPLI